MIDAVIDVAKERAKYQAELAEFESQLARLNQQRELLIRAICERRGILIFLSNLENKKEEVVR